jgi:hydrogenase-4 transcriptional activator
MMDTQYICRMPAEVDSLSLELIAWKEACRNLDLQAFVRSLSNELGPRLPVAQLIVRRLDLAKRQLHTVATLSLGESQAPLPARSQLTPASLEALMTWFGRRKLFCGRGGEGSGVLPAVFPATTRDGVIAGPLWVGEEPQGILLLVAAPDRRFGAEHAALALTLLEPFATALENDRRFQELTRLREAAVADNRALLSRLQRHDISESVVGLRTGLEQVMSQVEKVAATDTPVLILGETGSGKEVIARAIHARSPRARGPIVRVNCGAIAPELVDSELFGHEKGSFTGASATHRGWFERADGGTLFLDEIGELPLPAQVRLLRVLQDGALERVGGVNTLTVDVRLVAATHRDLQDMVEQGRFREDLWYRISVFPIRLPALRDRRGDIPELAAHFAWQAGKRLGSGPLVPSAADLEALLDYDWPGNVRELASVIERAAILGEGRCLEVAAALGGNGRRGTPAAPVAPTKSPAAAPRANTDALADAMRLHIERALERTRGRLEGPNGAATLLSINPHTLRARMRKLGIDWASFRAPAS